VKKYCEIIADNPSKAGWSWSCVSGPSILAGEQCLLLTRTTMKISDSFRSCG
jgi:hypothetical protein